MVLLYKAHQSIVEFLNTDADAPTCNRAEMAKEIAKVRQISNQESAPVKVTFKDACKAAETLKLLAWTAA